ncbi:hypothetical protein [Streptomyces sp. AC512_CC834]|uniref:hypothetical protein n=1 Tax=Streptomyces sp. AC512_CC834 TaxID=2823691 RepID=UPI001C25C700|nr:hypothetical protein [Streptomyces sp. AC512_CC834]
MVCADRSSLSRYYGVHGGGEPLVLVYGSWLDDALTALRTEDSHLAAATGETGAVLGFVTMEDVLTEPGLPTRT